MENAHMIKELKEKAILMLGSDLWLRERRIADFKSQFRKCISGHYGNAVKVEAYNFYNEVIESVIANDDKEFYTQIVNG